MISLLYNLIIAVSFFSLQHDGNYIDWKADRKLTWNDFIGKPDKNSPNAALTSSAINIDFTYGTDGLKYNLRCRFNKNTSWVKVKNDYILSHEQGHFDITEIFARRLYKALKEYKYNDATVKDDVNRIYDNSMHQLHDTQVQYDRETNSSLNTVKQAEWLKKISDELNELRDYANYN